MSQTGKVQMSENGNTTFVANPANISAYQKQAKPGSLYVEFDVDTRAIYSAGRADWGQTPGPGSLQDRLLQMRGGDGIVEMPSAYNIRVIGEK